METPNILAIDFGTTNTYFSKCPADQISPVGVDFGTGRDGLPTAILYRGEHEPLVGEPALHEYGEASDVERLLLGEGKVDNTDLDLLDALGQEDFEPLVAADQMAGPFVPDQGLDETELVDTADELLILPVIRLEILAGIVRGRIDPADSDRFDDHHFTS